MNLERNNRPPKRIRDLQRENLIVNKIPQGEKPNKSPLKQILLIGLAVVSISLSGMKIYQSMNSSSPEIRTKMTIELSEKKIMEKARRRALGPSKYVNKVFSDEKRATVTNLLLSFLPSLLFVTPFILCLYFFDFKNLSDSGYEPSIVSIIRSKGIK